MWGGMRRWQVWYEGGYECGYARAWVGAYQSNTNHLRSREATIAAPWGGGEEEASVGRSYRTPSMGHDPTWSHWLQIAISTFESEATNPRRYPGKVNRTCAEVPCVEERKGQSH